MVILDDGTEIEEDEEMEAFQNDVFLLLSTAECKGTKEPFQLSATTVTESFQSIANAVSESPKPSTSATSVSTGAEAPELRTEDTSKRHVIS